MPKLSNRVSGSYGKPEVTNSGSVISCASCVTSHSMRSAELERVAIFCDSPARGEHSVRQDVNLCEYCESELHVCFENY